jgi:dTDP-4-amino-4,6-dideoxygalactose transaminase
VAEVLETGSWCRISGDRAHTFETDFAAFQGARFGVAVNSGTSALELGLLALGIRPGDEVIVSPYTFMASASSVLVTRGTPVFVDIEPDTYNLDPDAIEAAITDRTFALMPVHFGGRPCDMDRILDIARKHELKVIEDASHAHGATWSGKGLGTIGDVGAFSLGSGKNLSAGEGGILLTNDEKLYQRAVELHDLWTGGLVQRSGEWGGGSFISEGGWSFPQAAPNYRMSEILAALLSSQLTRLDAETGTRFENGAFLDGLLDRTEGVETLRKDPRITRNSYHIFIFKYHPESFGGLPREKFIKALGAEGIPTSKGYTRGCHQHPLFLDSKGREVWPYNRLLTDRAIDYRSMTCPHTDRLCTDQTIWLSGSFMLDAGREGMRQVVEAIEKIRGHRNELAD